MSLFLFLLVSLFFFLSLSSSVCQFANVQWAHLNMYTSPHSIVWAQMNFTKPNTNGHDATDYTNMFPVAVQEWPYNNATALQSMVLFSKPLQVSNIIEKPFISENCQLNWAISYNSGPNGTDLAIVSNPPNNAIGENTVQLIFMNSALGVVPPITTANVVNLDTGAVSSYPLQHGVPLLVNVTWCQTGTNLGAYFTQEGYTEPWNGDKMEIECMAPQAVIVGAMGDNRYNQWANDFWTVDPCY